MSTPTHADAYVLTDVALLPTDLDRTDSRPHIEGRNISSRTYYVHGCRCPGCTAAATKTNTKSHRKSGRLPATRQRGHLPDVLAKLRNTERVRRNGAAREAAYRALRDKYRDEYDRLVDEARTAIDAAEGPLPGEDWYQSNDS